MTEPKPPRLSEDDLIARYFRPLATDPGAFRLGDDCAVLTPPAGEELVLKTDAVAAAVHFFAADPWDYVARKALRVNLSDLAAKGARPLGYLLSLGLPADWTEPQLAAFAAGLKADQSAFGLSLLGGDTIRSPDGLIVTITVLGATPVGRMVRRGGARVGDKIYVSGTLGDSALGLRLRLDRVMKPRLGLSEKDADYLLDRYLLPRPRLALAPALLAHANGGMDLSDGLMLDLTRMAKVSGVAAEFDVARIPLSAATEAALSAAPELIEAVVTGGDDYELLVTVAPEAAEAFERAAFASGVAVTEIGRIVSGNGEVRAFGPDGRPAVFASSGFSHF